MKEIDDIDAFLMLLMQTEKILKDFLELSKKKPNDAVNKFKLRLVNTILEQSNGFLEEDGYKPFESFETFDEDEVPSNSDVVLILSQYLGCLKKYGLDNTYYQDYKHYWIINGKAVNVEVDMSKLEE